MITRKYELNYDEIRVLSRYYYKVSQMLGRIGEYEKEHEYHLKAEYFQCQMDHLMMMEDSGCSFQEALNYIGGECGCGCCLEGKNK